jgi:hypothetical protein
MCLRRSSCELEDALCAVATTYGLAHVANRGTARPFPGSLRTISGPVGLIYELPVLFPDSLTWKQGKGVSVRGLVASTF